MKFVKDYMTDAVLRHELNELTEATFGFDFENWVINGYYEGDYIPYSFEEDGKILSNVSANIMHFVQNGEKRTYIQIGTVMTASEYRKQGLARAICPKQVSLDRVIGEINLEYKELRLGFTPRQNEMDLFEASVFDGGDDYRLFCMGSELESIEQEKLYFPTFSHA
ncbi:MAG: GNAT family N-acetyltransferase [Lachnospiraceae bacterium]|nr:GNAT family N-acetyltransferase [Lachnospiraceae bacterium]